MRYKSLEKNLKQRCLFRGTVIEKPGSVKTYKRFEADVITKEESGHHPALLSNYNGGYNYVLEVFDQMLHTEENKRKNDTAAAISRTDVFDFLVDIIPRDELKEEALSVAQGSIPLGGSSGDPIPYYYVPQQHPGMMMTKPVDQSGMFTNQQPRPPMSFMPWTQPQAQAQPQTQAQAQVQPQVQPQSHPQQGQQPPQNQREK